MVLILLLYIQFGYKLNLKNDKMKTIAKVTAGFQIIGSVFWLIGTIFQGGFSLQHILIVAFVTIFSVSCGISLLNEFDTFKKVLE